MLRKRTGLQFLIVGHPAWCLYGLAAAMVLAGTRTVHAQGERDSLSVERVAALVQEVERATNDYRLRLRANAIERMQPGVSQTVQLELQVTGLMSGYDIYALVFMAEGDRIVSERISRAIQAPSSSIRSFRLEFDTLNYSGFGTFSRDGEPVMKTGYANANGFRFTAGGKLGSGALSTLSLGSAAYPVHLSLPFETIARLWLADAPNIDELRVENERFPVTVNLAYLGTSLGSTSEILRNIALEIEPPIGGIYYDGILLVPAVVKRFANGFSVVRFDDRRTNRIVLSSKPPEGAQRPAPRTESRVREASRVGDAPVKLQVTASARGEVQRGRAATVDFHVVFGSLLPATELYVLLQPANGDKLVSDVGGATRIIEANQAAMRFCQDPEPRAGGMRISSRPVVLATPLFGAVEGGWIASVAAGGAGAVDRTITFTLPPLNAYYDRVRATPVALTWSDGQLCTVLETRSAPYTEIRITGP